MTSSNEKGYTLTEVIGVLSIVGVLVISMSMLVNSMFSRYKTNRVQDQITSLQKLINQRFVADGNYRSATKQQLIKDGVIPKDMVMGDKIMHAFGEADIKPGYLTFTIIFSELPQVACINLGIMSWIIQDTSDLVSIKINSDKYKWPGASQNQTSTLPRTTVMAAKSCKRGSDNVIEWEFQ